MPRLKAASELRIFTPVLFNSERVAMLGVGRDFVDTGCILLVFK